MSWWSLLAMARMGKSIRVVMLKQDSLLLLRLWTSPGMKKKRSNKKLTC